MNERTYASLSSLKEAMLNDPRYRALKEAENVLNHDEKALELAKEKDRLTAIYEEARFHYGESSEITKQAWHNLYIKKKELDELPSSLAYSKAYSSLASIYRELDSLLFSPYREHVQCGGKR